jgi:hypothetical protein
MNQIVHSDGYGFAVVVLLADVGLQPTRHDVNLIKDNPPWMTIIDALAYLAMSSHFGLVAKLFHWMIPFEL